MPTLETFSNLKLELARLNTRFIDASRYLREGLRLSPLTTTHGDIETGAHRVLAALVSGDTTKDTAIESLVAKTVRSHGLRGLSMLAQTLEAQRCAILVDLAGDARLESFQETSEDLMERFAALSFEVLTKAPRHDQRAAMAAIIACNQALSPPDSSTAAYVSDAAPYRLNFDAFTNESGLNTMLPRLDVARGSAVGVSGALLDIASRGADLAISVDANPDIKDAILVFAGVLLSVDRECQCERHDDTQRALEVRRRLTNGGKETGQHVAGELRALGLPEDLIARLPQLLEGLKASFGRAPEDVWLSSPDAPARIAHLTKLALEGRLLAVTADLSDPTLVTRVNALLEAHGSQVKTLHLSNALDYVANIGGTLANLGALKLTPDALVTTSTVHLHEPYDPTSHFYGRNLMTDLGTFQKPSALVAKEWLGRHGRGQQLHDAAWADRFYRLQLWDLATAGIVGTPEGSPPDNYADFAAALAEMRLSTYSDPERARLRLRQELKSRGDWYVYESLLGAEGALALSLPVPKDLPDVRRLAGLFAAEFWTPERKVAALEKYLACSGVPRAAVPEFLERAAACRNHEDVVAERWRMTGECEAAFHTWALATKRQAAELLAVGAAIDAKKLDAAVNAAQTLEALRLTVSALWKEAHRSP